MTDVSAAVGYARTGQSIQQRFEFYFVALSFTLLGLAVQTAPAARSWIVNSIEVTGWLSLLLAALLGLSRLEWWPRVYGLLALREGQEERGSSLREAVAMGAYEVQVLDPMREVPATELIDDADRGRDEAKAKLEEVKKRERRKYKAQKVAFVAGLALVMASRAAALFASDTSAEQLAHLCTVDRLIDGDTVVCAEGERVRLLLIDAPEMSQSDFGVQSKAQLETLLPIRTAAVVELDVQERDRYGRVLAYLHALDGTMVNEEIVRAGYAAVSVCPPNVKYVARIRAAEAVSVEARRGLWANSAFEYLPADHRAGRCE